MSMKTLWNLFMRSRADGITGLAAMAAYNFFLVMPAILIMIVSVISFFPVEDLSGRISSQFEDVLPADALSLVTRIVEQTLERGEGQVFILITSLLGAVYVMNSGYAGLISSLNRVYQLEEKRSWPRVRLRALVLSVVAGSMILSSFALILLVPYLLRLAEEQGSLLQTTAQALRFLRWPLIVAIAVAGMEMTHKYGPCQGPRWRFISPGTAFSVAAWVAATLGFGYYVNHFASYDKVYGTLGAVIVVLTWMWMSALIFLIGAEINMMWRERIKATAAGFPEVQND